MKTKRCFLAAIIFVFAYASSFAFGVPVVSWKPSAVSVSLLSGTLRSVVVQFSTSRTLRDVDLAVVKGIGTYVSIVPSHLDQVSPGTTYSVQLLLSIPQNTQPGVYSGTLQLQSGKIPRMVFAVPLPITIVVGQPSANVIPSGIALPSLDRIVPESNGKPSYVANELDLFVLPETTDEQLETLAAAEGATFFGHDSGFRLYQLNILFPNFSGATETARRLQQSYKFIRFGAPSIPFLPNSTFPTDPSWATNVRASESWAQTLIDLPEAWDLETGTFNIPIAVVDLGFSAHDDLNPVLSESNLDARVRPDHGVAVSSLAAAVGNNPGTPIGIAGAMWLSHLIEIAAAGDDNLAITAMEQAVDIATRDGAQSLIINFSGGNDFSPTCSPAMTDAERTVQKLRWQQPIDYAVSKGKNVLFVFSAGNNRVQFGDSVPAALSNEFANVVSVSAVDRSRNEASYSNYGNVSVWAPGGDFSPYGLCGGRTAPAALDSATIWVAKPGTPAYGYDSAGTSLAAPFVSGVAGLMLSANPSLTAAELKNYIDATADPTGHVDPSGTDIRVLNAFHAVQQAIANPRFDFALDFILVAGNVNGGTGFVDDFNDGSLTTVPTSNINCNLNSAPVSESGGFLHLSSTDGANAFTPGALVDNCFLGLDAIAYRFNDGSGNSVITASFRADSPLPSQAYGLQLFTYGTDELVSIFVTNNGAGPVIGALTKTAAGVVTVENVALNLTGQRVLLRLAFNDATNQVTQSFSTDGSTFTTVSVPQPGTVMTTGTQALTSVFGSVQLQTSP